MELFFFRWKGAKFSQNGIDHFLSSWPPDRHTIVRAKIRGKKAFFCKSHKNALSRVIWHAEFISALKTELNPTVFEKNAKNKTKYLLLLFLIYFCDFL